MKNKYRSISLVGNRLIGFRIFVAERMIPYDFPVVNSVDPDGYNDADDFFTR